MTTGGLDHGTAAADTTAAAVAAVDALLAIDHAALDDASLHELFVTVQRLRARLGIASSEAFEQWDQRKVWLSDGSRSPAHRFARETRSAVNSGRRELRWARALAFMPLTRQAVLDGRLSFDHVDLFEQAATPARRARFTGGGEALLVELCTGAPYVDAVRYVRYWEIRCDAELAEERRLAGHDDPPAESSARSKLYASTSYRGRLALNGDLAAIDGAIVHDELDRLAEALRLADLAAGIERTPAQRRAAALVEMATRSATAPVGGRRPQPLFTVLVGDRTLESLCELADGTVLGTAELLPHLDRAMIESVIFDGPITVVGVSQRRTFTGAVRRAVKVRDRRCRHPSECDVPADRCDVDHIIPWSNDGPTSQFNGRLLCTTHNRIPEHRDQDARPAPSRPVTPTDVAKARVRWTLLHAQWGWAA